MNTTLRFVFLKKATSCVITCFMVVVIFTVMSGCKKSSNSTLSPARSIAGTWKGLVNDTVYYLTNCTSSNFTTYATFQCTFTFVITAVNDSNISVAIYGNELSTASDACGENSPPASGYPITFGGVVSSSRLELTDYVYGMNTSGVIEYANFIVGNFAYTSKFLTGSIYWLQYYDSYSAIGWSTSLISLTKQ